MREIRFALGYMPHRLWGRILLAQVLEKEPGREFHIPGEYIQNDPSTMAYQRLSPMQREVLQLVDEYSDRNLHRVFSRQKTVKQFQDQVDRELIRTHIRPYIEKKLFAILQIARDNRIPVFVKEKSTRNVFPEDFLKLERMPAVPVFSFSYRNQLSYALSLIHGEHQLILKDVPLELVTNDPCTIILGDTLYFVNDIDSKKLKPFMTKERVLVPLQSEGKYFGSFVRNTLRDYHTLNEGFEVRTISPFPRAVLCLEVGISKRPVWILSLYYQKYRITRESPLRRFVNYLGEASGHAFEKFERDFEWELEMVDLLNEVGLRSSDECNFYLNHKFNKDHVSDIYSAINFINENGSALAASGIEIKQRLDREYYLGKIELNIDSREKNDWFDIYGQIRLGDLEIPFIQLKNHILEGNREFLLPGNSIFVLPEEWFARYLSMFEFGKSAGDGIRIHKQHFSMVDNSVRGFHAETLAKLEALKSLESLPETAVPAGLDATLRDYQLEGFRWLCHLQQNDFGGCLADDMGLGKTLQAIAILLRSRELGSESGETDKDTASISARGQLSLFSQPAKKLTSLIVVPASLIHNWARECRRFAPGLKILSHAGAQRNRELSNFSYYDLVLSTYHTVRQDSANLSTFRFHYIILDESQMIKNPSSKLYHAMASLQSDYKLVLTGTPIENSLTDLWSQINFVNPGLLGTLSFFKRTFVQPIEKKGDESREEKLKELIHPFILRRTKDEVARELPPLYEQIRYVNMTESQHRLYEEEKSQVRNAILENFEELGVEKSSMIVLQALTRLRQIANHPDLVEEFTGEESGKFTEVYRNIESVISEGHKVLVFSSFVKHLDLFRTRFEEDGIGYAYLTGSRNQRQRETAVKDFQANSDCSVFLISLRAGGVGLNLTAADYVFILDPWWNPAAEMQALSRAHRIGRESRVFVYRFISNDSIEEKIQRLQERKRELAETFVTSNNPLKSLSEKELIELFT
ncbi:MAG: DEAD/DEAH box helicase [Bacteroidales bacterium]|nr:DEAD/DEAH box helicase [Bacteroidales bacterium]